MEPRRVRAGLTLHFLSTGLVLTMMAASAVAQVTPAPVDASTTSVATIPRPPFVPEPPPTSCPQDDATLAPFQSSWLSPAGVLSIPAGQRVLLRPASDIPAGTLLTELVVPTTSELVFDDEAATLRVRDVDVSGTLRLGSATCRLSQTIRFEFDTDEVVSSNTVRQSIFTREGLGLVVESTGVLEIYGRLHQPTWTRLASSAAAGASQVVLAEPVDWDVGQEIVVVTTDRRDFPYADENEVRSIVAIDPGGTTLTLDQPLAYHHYGGPEYQAEVGLLSRSIVFDTADAVVAQAPEFGGHILSRSADIRLSGVELRRLGQQNFVGRHPFHLQLVGDTAGQAQLVDSSIRESSYRCAVVRVTDNAVLARNVAYDVRGNCFMTVDGVETGNDFSFNLVAQVKGVGQEPLVQGPFDFSPPFGGASQQGVTFDSAADLAHPADRLPAAFFITNGDNQLVGNAASGGFAAYSFPVLPEALQGPPLDPPPDEVPISQFDGNTAHSSGYLWLNGGCVYVGGQLTSLGTPDNLRYASGRVDTGVRRDEFTNTKTFLCQNGLVHWGQGPGLTNFESWDSQQSVQLFGQAFMQSAVIGVETPNVTNLQDDRWLGFERGFQLYDTFVQTLLRGVVFRNFQEDPAVDRCIFRSLTFSDQFTPQRMTAMAEIYYAGVDDSLRFCHEDQGTLSSRNFNFIDEDGTATDRAGDGLPLGTRRIVGSAYTDSWNTSDACRLDSEWGLYICPEDPPQNVASIRTTPNQGVDVRFYRYEGPEFGAVLGSNGYSETQEFATQITGPSELGWHHTFPNGTPEQIEILALQVPENSIVVYSFSLPPGVQCSSPENDYALVPSFAEMLSSPTPSFYNSGRGCFIAIPNWPLAPFEAVGLSTPGFGFSFRSPFIPGSEQGFFTMNTGCTASNPQCFDIDGDGIPDSLESGSCTDLLDLDTDDDGLADGVEDANQNGVRDTGETDPCNADSDGDQLQDGTEVAQTAGSADPDGFAPMGGTDPAVFVPDPDPGTTTDPLNPDSDGDGASDGQETLAGTDPNDPDDFPVTPVPSLGRWGALGLVAALLAAPACFGRRRSGA